ENSMLLKLERQGRILRGRFTPGASELEWCDRRLLARIHRYTLNRLRSEIEPAAAADFMRFLLHWQHVAAGEQLKGAEGLAAIVAATGLLPTLVERGLAELVSAGLVTADSFSGLRALLAPQHKRNGLVQGAGRWSLLDQKNTTTEQIAQGLLKRYGVVFRALLQRESLPPWRDLVKLYRRLEARGEIRGGRFVA